MREKFLFKKTGITFLEIMIAVMILTIALLPIFNFIHRGTEDTDINAAQAFAITKATEILNTILDNVHFEILRVGCPAIMCSEDIAQYYQKGPIVIPADAAKTYSSMLFGDRTGYETTVNGKPAYFCQGKIQDPRGITYLCTLLVEEIGDSSDNKAKPETITSGEFPEKKEFTFSYFKNPDLVSKASWIPVYQPTISDNKKFNGVETARFELECKPPQVGIPGIAVPPSCDNVYAQPDYAKTKVRITQRMCVDKTNYAPPSQPNDVNPSGYCAFKRLIIEVQWNMDRKYWSTPQEETHGNVQRIHLMTIKGDVSR